LLNKAFILWKVNSHALLIGYLVVTEVTEDIMTQAIGEHSQIISTPIIGIG